MCGYTGVYSLGGRIDNKENIKRKILNSEIYIENRGPDERGFYENEKSILLHRRLKVISLDHGKQPLVNGSSTLVYNGEIYNYRELGEKYNLDTEKSDSNLLFQLLQKKGISITKELDGMFSFVFISNEGIFLSRDIAGEKPLYYSIVGDLLYFSSSLSALNSILDKELNKTVVVFSMMYGILNMGKDTIYDGIKSLEPSTWLKFTKNGSKQENYFRVWRDKKYYSYSFEDAKTRFEEILKSAVKKRLISNRPLGGFLSGGVDSSAITFFANEFKEDYTTYSISIGSDISLENYHADLLSKSIGSNHIATEYRDLSLNSLLENLVESKKLPLSTPNETAIDILSKKAKEFLTVVLSGEGADELLYGYNYISRGGFDYIRYRYKQYLKNRASFGKSLIRLYGKLEFIDEQDIFQFYFRRVGYDLLLNILSPEYNLKEISEEIREYFDTLFARYKEFSVYERWQSIIFEINLRSLLERLDFNTMNNSLEARAPFVDRDLIDFSTNIPISYKLKFRSEKNCFCDKNALEFSQENDTTKYILRSILKRRIPKEILERPKHSFPVPYQELNSEKNINNLLKKLRRSNQSILNYRGVERCLQYLKNDSSGFTTWIVKNYLDFEGIIL
ncbi:MAG: asparagine synthase (glutamine-hydrolyzing) [Candidatus Delongbacteria bacterium]|nr:MAG: asparagine synthase (glutamine-hydrolyzing) [Candidatus Delongbacteria bacterium]